MLDTSIYFVSFMTRSQKSAHYEILLPATLLLQLTITGRYRKSFLLGCAFVGSIATMLFLPIVPKVYILGAILAVISNVCIGTSFVLLNSFLPLLVRYHPSVQKSSVPARRSSNVESDLNHHSPEDDEDDYTQGEPLVDSTAALLPASDMAIVKQTTASGSRASPQLQLSTEISSYGMGIGYIASVLVQCLCIVILVLTGSSLFSLRLVLFVIGAWWLVFSIPAALWLRPRPGPPLPSGTNNTSRTWSNYILYAWSSLLRTILRAGQLRDVILFLSAWFLLSDGIATVSGTAVLFAKTQLHMKPAALASINVITTICGVIGAFSWARLSRLMSLKPSQTILACILLFELIPLYGLLGFIPAVQRWGVLGLQQPWEMYPLGAIYGFVLGGLSSYCRSLFGELIPPGSEAAFYALYAITDKGSSVFGPAIVGFITDRAGEIRPAFVFLAVLIALPAPLMWSVDVERGKRDGERLVRELKLSEIRDDHENHHHQPHG